MKKQFSIGAAVLLAIAAGCAEGQRGGPGAVPATNAPTTVNRPAYTDTNDTFTLSVPTLTTYIKQGETKSATIGLSRGKNFQEDVSLQLSNIPKGITIEPVQPKIMHDEKDATVTIHAANDAALGDFSIKVTGHPATGADATNELKITVERHD